MPRVVQSRSSRVTHTCGVAIAASTSSSWHASIPTITITVTLITWTDKRVGALKEEGYFHSCKKGGRMTRTDELTTSRTGLPQPNRGHERNYQQEEKNRRSEYTNSKKGNVSGKLEARRLKRAIKYPKKAGPFFPSE